MSDESQLTTIIQSLSGSLADSLHWRHVGTYDLSASWQDLLQNLAIVAILVSVWTYGLDATDGKPRWTRELLGMVLTGTGVVLLMLVPFEVEPGIIIDLRGVLIALAGFMGSPLIGIATGLVAAVFRIYLGGAGTGPGIVTIASATVVGVLAHVFLRGRAATNRDILVFALVAALATVPSYLVLPTAMLVPTLLHLGPPFAIMTFVSTVVIGLALVEANRRREVARTNRFYRNIIDALPEPLNAKDLAGRFLAANPATACQVNVPNVAALIGKSDFDLFPPDVAERFRADEEQVLAAGKPATVEQEIAREDGSRQWLSTLKVPLLDEYGAIVGLLTHNHDITDRKHMEDEVAESRRRLNDAMEHMADGLVMFDREGRIVLCNDQFRALFPKTADLRVPGERLETILRASVERGEQSDVPPGAIDVWVEQTLAGLAEASDRDIRLADGRWLTARTRPTADGGSLTVFVDITPMKQAEAAMSALNRRLTSLASHDSLTGLMNRRGYDDALEHIFAQCRRNGTPLSLLLIDVDHFKSYNDTYGHPAGDECLRTIGSLLRLGLRRPGDVVARYGGEEFAAILPDTPAGDALRLAETLRKKAHGLGLRHTGSRTGVLTISIGVATVSGGGMAAGPEALAARADAALYEAKTGGRNRAIAADQASRLEAAG